MRPLVIYSPIFILCLLLTGSEVLAQPSVGAGTMGVSSLYRAFKGIAMGMCAICALVGSVKVYRKLNKNSDEGMEGVLSWFSGLIVSIAVLAILDNLFR
ncbi:MAG: DUF4134 domain-containing protein [Rudanella sp.]|nr:DUF4134 domain-containing protein [Rudanella sp.]